MMNKKEFMEYVKNNVKEYLPPAYESAQIDIQEVMKTNDQHKTGITIRKEGETITPNIYLDSLYEDYKRGKSIDSIVGEVADTRIETDNPEMENVRETLLNYEELKERLQIRLCDPNLNKERLERAVYSMMGDFAATYHVNLFQGDDGNASVMVTPRLMESWQITKEQLHVDAMNADRSQGPVFQSMSNVLDNLMSGAPVENLLDSSMDFNVDMMMPAPMMVLSNQNKMFGASMMMQQDVMDQIGEMMKGDYYILPSSVHEIIVVPMNMEMELPELNAMVSDINATEVENDEVLTNKVQVYDCKEHAVVNAVAYEKAHIKEQDKADEKSTKSIHERLGEKASEVKDKAASAIPTMKKEKTAEATL